MRLVSDLEQSVESGLFPDARDWFPAACGFMTDTSAFWAVRKDGKAHIQAGAGVVADSAPPTNTKRPSPNPKPSSAPSLWRRRLRGSGDFRSQSFKPQPSPTGIRISAPDCRSETEATRGFSVSNIASPTGLRPCLKVAPAWLLVLLE